MPLNKNQMGNTTFVNFSIEGLVLGSLWNANTIFLWPAVLTDPLRYQKASFYMPFFIPEA